MTKKTQRKGADEDKRTLSVNKLKMVIALSTSQKYSIREIGRLVGVASSTVSSIVSKVNSIDELSDFNPSNFTDAQIVNLCYPKLKPTELEIPGDLNVKNQLIPNYLQYAFDKLELQLSLKILYENYLVEVKSKNAKPICVSYFYRQVSEKVDRINKANPDVYLPWEYKFGCYCQVDFTGDKYKVSTNNGILECWIFLLVFPASYFIYGEFVPHQSTECVCNVISNFVKHYGILPVFFKIDNAKAQVDTHHKGIADVIYNKNFEKFVNSMGACLDAAPIYRGQSKSAVEASVGWLQEKLRGKTREYFRTTRATLSEHNDKLFTIIEEINRSTFRKSSTRTREFLFVNYEVPACHTVTQIMTYEGESYSVKVPRNYHVNVNNHNYSVPYTLSGKYVEVLVTDDFVVFKHENKEVARHIRKDNESGNSTEKKHMSPEHENITNNYNLLNDPDKVLEMAKACGETVYKFCLQRMNYESTKGVNVFNGSRCCKSIIDLHNKVRRKDLLNLALESVLKKEPNKWNSYVVVSVYNNFVKEKIEFINSQTTLEFAKDPSGKPEISEADLIEPDKKSGTAANTSNNSSDSSDSSDIEIMRATEDGAYLRNK